VKRKRRNIYTPSRKDRDLLTFGKYAQWFYLLSMVSIK
jgi:hypothetical protein